MSRETELTDAALAELPSAPVYIPFHRPLIGEAEEQAVVDVLRSGWVTRGNVTARFEKEFSDYVAANHAVGVNSCTAALHLALVASDVGPGDEVITTPYTFAATANAIVHTGATPVFVDINPSDLNIAPGAAAESVSDRTRAIIPVHFGGAPCDMDAIAAVAADHGLAVIEDAAHALGSAYKGRPVGSISDFTAFSFYATKNITTGEGGMLTVKDDAVAERVRTLSLHGMSSDAWKRYSRDGHSYYEVVEPGFKYNMFDLQAAMGIEQLKRDTMMRQRREQISSIYDELLDPLPLLGCFSTSSDITNAHHLYLVRLDTGSLSIGRDQVAQAMELLNVGVSVHFRSLHLHPYYRERFHLRPDDFPESLRASETTLSLPIYPLLTDEDAVCVAETLKALLERYAL